MYLSTLRQVPSGPGSYLSARSTLRFVAVLRVVVGDRAAELDSATRRWSRHVSESEWCAMEGQRKGGGVGWGMRGLPSTGDEVALIVARRERTPEEGPAAIPVESLLVVLLLRWAEAGYGRGWRGKRGGERTASIGTLIPLAMIAKTVRWSPVLQGYNS